MSALRRHLAVYRMFLRNSLIRDMSFKANFLLWFVTDSLWFVGQLLFVEVMFAHTDSIVGWGKWEVVLLIGVHQMISQLFQMLFYPNLTAFPELVRTGRLDLVLLLPVDAQFSVSVQRFSLDCVANTLVGAAIAGFSLWKLGLVPGPGAWALFALGCALGVAIHYAVMFGLACLCFWIVRAQGIVFGYYSLVSLSRYPEAVYRGVFRFVFLWLLPVILVANVPARILAHPEESHAGGLARLALAALIALAGSRLVWLAGLRRYGSASS